MTLKLMIKSLSHPVWNDKKKHLGQEVIGWYCDY